MSLMPRCTCSDIYPDLECARCVPVKIPKTGTVTKVPKGVPVTTNYVAVMPLDLEEIQKKLRDYGDELDTIHKTLKDLSDKVPVLLNKYERLVFDLTEEVKSLTYKPESWQQVTYEAPPDATAADDPPCCASCGGPAFWLAEETTAGVVKTLRCASPNPTTACPR